MDVTLVTCLRAAAERLFRTGPVLAAYGYGSRISGRPRPTSDLDIGYYLKGDVDDRRVHGFLREGLSDIESFANAIARREW